MVTSNKKRKGLSKTVKKNWDLYLLILPCLLYFFLFNYWPMYGFQLAFKDFNAVKGIWGSTWVGFVHFKRFFDSANALRIILNTLSIGLYSLLVSFPIAILFAVMINEVRHKFFKKFTQTLAFFPHFISIVVLVGIMLSFLSPSTGIINNIIKAVGIKPVFFMGEPKWFKTLYVFLEVWQNTGWRSIVFIAALSSIDIELYEAAYVEGITRIKKILYIDIPSILPTIIILFILYSGRIMNVGFEKVYLMQNDLNLSVSEVINTYIYRMGISGAQYDFATAVGLFNSVINCALLLSVNAVSKKISNIGLL